MGRKVGGWVGGYVQEQREWTWKGGWVGGWVGGKGTDLHHVLEPGRGRRHAEEAEEEAAKEHEEQGGELDVADEGEEEEGVRGRRIVFYAVEWGGWVGGLGGRMNAVDVPPSMRPSREG